MLFGNGGVIGASEDVRGLAIKNSARDLRMLIYRTSIGAELTEAASICKVHFVAPPDVRLWGPS
jgi:hypothetical protein